MGFFSEVQSWFNDNGDNGGRYVQKIIIEWAKSDKAGFKKFMGSLGVKLPSKYQLVKEYPYKTDRSSDLALLDENEEPLLLIEIKWNDALGKEMGNKKSQLTDYVNFCLNTENCNLLVLTKENLSVLDVECLLNLQPRCVRRSFGDMATFFNISNNHTAELFLDYLKDKGVVMNQIDTASLFRFFHRFVNPYNGSGRVSSNEQLTNGPEQFSNLLNNMRLISQEFNLKFKSIRKEGRSASVDYYVNPYFSKKKIESRLSKCEFEEDKVHFDHNDRKGGYAYVYANQRVFNDPWMQIDYGFFFELEPNKDHTMNVSIYAQVKNKGIEDKFVNDDTKDYKSMLESGNDVDKIIKGLNMQIRNVLKLVINEGSIGGERVEQLKNLLENFK